MTKKEKFVNVDKLQKKEQKKRNAKQRGQWVINPLTRVVPSGKAYSRKKLDKSEKLKTICEYGKIR